MALLKQRERFHFRLTISSVLGNRKLGINDNGAAEPTQILLESLFSQTRKMEEWMNQDYHLMEGVGDEINLKNMESDLCVSLVALKKKEESLKNAESLVLLEHTELERAKEDLERREKELDVIAYKQQKLEDELKDGNLKLESKTMQIEDLKLQVNERDCCIASSQLVLDSKQRELDIMRNNLVAKNEEISRKNFELATKALLLDEANEVINKQDAEIQKLHKMVHEKQRKLEVLLEIHSQDEEKLITAENNLSNRAMEYLVAHEKVNKIAVETSRNFKEINETLAGFGTVKRLLADVRSELVVSQQALSWSREHMKSQELLVEGQLAELDDQKASMMSYFESLKHAYVEVESEGAHFIVDVARSKELEDELSVKKKTIHKLEDDLKSEKVRLEQALQDNLLLKEELDKKCKELKEAHTTQQHKDLELMNAKFEIQRLQSQQSLLNQILSEKDLELLRANERLKKMTKEVVELKMLVSSKEDLLVQTSNILKEKDAHLQMMQDELNDSKLKYVDAKNAVQRIVDFTNELITSAKNKSEMEVLRHSSDMPFGESKLERNEFEAEIALARENMKAREMEFLASQRSLAIKNKELNIVCEKLELKEKKVNTAKEEIMADELKKLNYLAQERIGEKTIGDLAMEKLQLEATQLEAEVATSALTVLAELSRELGNTTTQFSNADFTTSTVAEPAYIGCIDVGNCSSSSTGNNHNDLANLSGVKSEVARLVSLTEKLIHEAGIGGCM